MWVAVVVVVVAAAAAAAAVVVVGGSAGLAASIDSQTPTSTGAWNARKELLA